MPDPETGPLSPDRLFELGYERLYAGAPDAAAAAFRAAGLLAPDLGEAWGALADSLLGAGAAAAAVTAYGWAVTLDPRSWPLRLGLAEALRAAGRTDEAVASGRLLVEERPDSAAARLCLARALVAGGHSAEAIAEYREALVLRAGDLEAALELAALLVESGDALAAVELLQPLVRRHEDEAALHHNIGRVWIVLREPDKALAALRRARDLDEGDGLGSAALIEALESGGPTDLTAAYVRALFDRYADSFDQHLLGKLGYVAPVRLRAAVDALPGPRTGLRVLDLGCGTGLGGEAFRPLAGHLAGVDLSPRMVEKARQRNLYDDLQVGDVVAAMDAAPGSWDLLVAADVLVYIGDLAPLFAAARRALRPGGHFAATVERSDGEDFTLGPSRRYAHAEAYLRRLASEQGFAVVTLEPVAPRTEKGVPIPGLLFVLEKPTS
nr:methyltransferase domain-containing protein [Azospirillum sp. SYSU D00513]